MYKKQVEMGNPENAMFIILLKLFGAMFKPNGRTFHWNAPLSVLKAVTGLESLCIGIWWKPEERSITEKYFAFPRLSKMSSIRARGNLSGIKFLLTAR